MPGPTPRRIVPIRDRKKGSVIFRWIQGRNRVKPYSGVRWTSCEYVMRRPTKAAPTKLTSWQTNERRAYLPGARYPAYVTVSKPCFERKQASK